MKRKCGTCKYFEDRGVANSGTCQHHQRRELRDVVLVRQTELACRNSWDQDLWEPRPDLAAAESRNPRLDDMTIDDGIDDASVGRWDTDEVFRGAEDVPSLSPYGEEPDRVTDVQVPIIRRGGRATPAPLRLSVHEVAEPDEATWLARPSVLAARQRAEEERRKAIQARQAAELEEIARQMESEEAIGAPAERAGAWSSGSFGRAGFDGGRLSDPYDSRDLRDMPPRLEGNVRIDQPRDIDLPAASTNAVSQGTEPLPTREVLGALEQQDSYRASFEPVVHVDGSVYASPQPQGRRLPVVQELAPPDRDDPLDQQEQLRGIKRCCGTCRDFRQVGDGSRGQCVNPYAFSERRMVQSDQLACRSSLGMWWMPSDDIWLERADTSHHGRPTPLLDAAMRAEHVGHGGRDSRS